MKNRIFAMVLLLSIIAAAGTWAQNLPSVPGSSSSSIWSSPQSTTTEGRYRSNADNFIRPDQYSGVRFNKWFGMVSFLWDGNYEAIATVGFATRVDNVYIGAFYNGNFWAGAPANDYTTQEPNTVPNGGSAGKTYDVYSNISTAPGPVNNVSVLIGLADMGFRLTYRTNHQSFKESNIVTDDQLYKNYRSDEGYIAPQIAWAMAKDLTKNGIRPYATVDLVFDRNYRKVETAGGYSGEKVEHSLNHFDPSFALGMGGYTFYNEDGFKASADVDYLLELNIYNNEYSYLDGNKYKTAKFKGEYSPASISWVEKKYASNTLTPSVSGSWSDEKLALKFKFNMPLSISARKQNTMDLNSSNDLVYHGFSDATTTFIFRPDLRLALQYKIVPNRLTMNAGARIQTAALTLTKIDRVYYEDDSEMGSQTVHQKNFGSAIASRFHIGATYSLTENAWVEATTGVTNSYGNEGAIEVFAPGGLFSFGSILFSLKF